MAIAEINLFFNYLFQNKMKKTTFAELKFISKLRFFGNGKEESNSSTTGA